MDNACVFKEIAVRGGEVWPLISKMLRSTLDEENRAAVWAIRARKDADQQHAALLPALRRLMVSDASRDYRLSIAFAILNLGRHAVAAMPEFLSEARRPDLTYDDHFSLAYIDLAERTGKPGRHLAALLRQESTAAGTVLRIAQFLAGRTERTIPEVAAPLRRLIARHADAKEMTLLTALVNAYVRHERPELSMPFLIEVRMASSAAFDDVFDSVAPRGWMPGQLEGMLGDARRGPVAAVALGKLLRRMPAQGGDSTALAPHIVVLLSNRLTFDQGVDSINAIGRPVSGAAALLLARYGELSTDASTRRKELARAIGTARGLSDADIRLLAQYASNELESARQKEPAGAVGSDALDALSMLSALPAAAVPDLIRGFKIVYGTPESRATAGLLYSSTSLRKIITALAKSHAPEGAFALVSLSDFVSRSQAAYLPVFELHLMAQALADMGSHSVDALARKLNDATGLQCVFLEAALAGNVEPAAGRALAAHAALAWPGLIRDVQDPRAGEGWTDRRAIMSQEEADGSYSTRLAVGFQTKWGFIPDTRAGMAIFRMGRLGLAERPPALDRIVAALENQEYHTEAAAFTVLAGVRDRSVVIAAFRRHLDKSNSAAIRDYLSRLESPSVVPEVRY